LFGDLRGTDALSCRTHWVANAILPCIPPPFDQIG